VDDEEDYAMKRFLGWFGLVAVLSIGATVFASDRRDLATVDGTKGRVVRTECIPDSVVSILPFSCSSTLVDAGNDCDIRDTQDRIYEIHISHYGSYTFTTCGTTALTDTYLYLLTHCCGSEVISSNDDGCGTVHGPSALDCITLDQGVYYLLVEAGATNAEGPFSLSIFECPDPCETALHPDGTYPNREDGFSYTQTIDSSASAPYYDGPYSDLFACAVGSETYGFDYLSWYDEDFGWQHSWPLWSETNMCVDSARLTICAWDVDHDDCIRQHPNHPDTCEYDVVWADNDSLGVLGGTTEAWSVTSFPVPPELLTDDGVLNVFVDIDALSDYCNWAVIIHRSQLTVFYHVCPPHNPIVGWDLGDLDTTCYHLTGDSITGPANAIHEQNIAWLGSLVTPDVTPNIPNADTGDDGVVFLNPPWQPCTQVCVDVTVTAGPGYNGEPLYLFGWKNGNPTENCNFDDWLCDGQAPECLISGARIMGLTAGHDSTYHFCFEDPGVTDHGTYDGVFRFRLLSADVGCRLGLTYVDNILGETEDYVQTDLQLPVELQSFEVTQNDNAVQLLWTTASERNNDHFVIERGVGGAWQTIANRIPGAHTSGARHNYAYRDESVNVGTTYTYRLTAVDINGTAQMLAERSVGVVNADPATITDYKLYANYPNPFNPTTTITYDIKESGLVHLQVYDVMGRLVATLVKTNQHEGRYHVQFDAQNLPSGVYLYRLQTPGFTDLKKMILLK
jgi:hypothetical protein